VFFFLLYNEVPQDSKNNNMIRWHLAEQCDQLSHDPVIKRDKKAELTWQGAQSCRERISLAAFTAAE
jgi:hypothetical protein